MKKILLFIVVITTLIYAKPIVTTTILPTKYFVEQIAGDTVKVDVLIGAGVDPHTYEPKPSQMKNLEKSDLHFAVGVEFDQIWLMKLAKQFLNLKIIHTDKGVEKMAMVEHFKDNLAISTHTKYKKTTHDVHENHDHESGLDPHIWLDPELVKIQSQNIADALTQEYPENSALYTENLAKFISRVDEFDKSTKNRLKDIKTHKFMVYHPSWGYFAKRYDLVQIPAQIEGKEPKPADLNRLIKMAKEKQISVIFVAPQFSKKPARLIAKESGAKVVEIEHLPKDWIAEMEKVVDIFANYLK